MLTIRKLTKALSVMAVLGLMLFLYLGLQGEALAANLAQATLQGTIDPALVGQITFTPTAAGLQIDATVSHVPPGYHGFHLHANESCADGGNGAGGHFNPDGVKHGKLISDGFENAHAGDLGNLSVGLDGTGEYHQTLPGLGLMEGVHAIAHHSVILHSNIDSYVQPTGNAGGRIACALITLN